MLTRAQQSALAAVVALVAIVVLVMAASPRARAAEEKPAAAGDAANSATGTWKWSIQGPNGDIETTLKLKQDGEKLTGTITGFNGNESEIQEGAVKDGQVSFKVVRDMFGSKATTTYTATLADGSLKGKSETVFIREFNAKKADNADKAGKAAEKDQK
jgi:hypothetical protein